MERRRRVNNVHLCLFLCCVFLVTSGCGRLEIQEYNLQTMSSPKIPLRVGLFMSPAFRDYQYVGEGMRRGAEEAARLAFEQVVIIDSLSSDEIPTRGIEAIASPEIIGAAMHSKFLQKTLYQITCKWTIWTLDGKVVYLNTFRGEGVDGSFVGKTRIETSMTLAAKDQYEKFLADVLANNWWERIKSVR